MTVIFANSGSVQPAQGGEVACCAIAAGPYAAVDAYVSGGSAGVQLEFRLYATVGTLRTLVAVATYAGPPVGAPANQGTVLEWTVIGQQKPSNPVMAGGTQYDLVVFGVNGAGGAVNCTLAGTSGYDANAGQSATVAFPANYGSTTVVTNVGCSQLADVGMDQLGVAECAMDVFVSCGAGSVEALVGSGTTGGTNGKADVIRQLPLPVGTQYRLAVRNVGIAGSGNVTASLATYSNIVAAPPGPGGSTNAIIYRPGAASSGYFVQTWAEVQSFITETEGTGIVYVDDSIVTPAPVPAASGITDGFGRLVLKPYRQNQAGISTSAATYLVVSDGATIKGISQVVGTINVLGDCKSAQPSFDWDYSGGATPAIFIEEQAVFGTTATATQPCIVIPGALGSELVVHLHVHGSLSMAGASPIATVPAGSFITVDMIASQLLGPGGTAPIPAGWATGAGTVQVFWDAESFQLSLGTIQGVGISSATINVQVRQDSDPYIIDFVADCGADPNGIVDAAAALNAAYNLLVALLVPTSPRTVKQSCVLVIPPGLYVVKSVPAQWDFNGGATSLRIQGYQDASIITFDQIAGPGLNIGNLENVLIEGITFTGVNNDVTNVPDCTAALEIGIVRQTIIRDCRFVFLWGTNGVIYSFTTSVSVEDCQFLACCSSAGGAVIHGLILYSLSVRRCTFIDVPITNSMLNGNPPAFAGPKVSQNAAYIRQDDSLAVTAPTETRGVLVEQCLFDEGCSNTIYLVGGPTGNIASATLRQNTCNVPINGGASSAALHFENVNDVKIESWGATHNGSGNPNVPFASFIGVAYASIRNLYFNPASFAKWLVADAACKYLRIENSPTLLPANIFDGTAARCLTKTIETQNFGTDTEVQCYVGLGTATPTAVGNLLKIAGGNIYSLLGTGDGVGLAAGVSLDAAAGATAIRVARRGQVVTALSDGSTAIAIGDPITNLGALAAGQVKKAVASGTTPILGIATSVAASGGGAVLFDMLFETGMA
jgi:hypothetical protein